MSAIRRRKSRKSLSEKALIEARKKDAQTMADIILSAYLELKNGSR